MLTLPITAGHAAACGKWGKGEVIGLLDAARLGEASSITASINYPDRLYHMNDSGLEATLFVTDLQGRDTRSVRIKRFDAGIADVEDLALGPCGDGRHCLFVADIGDNSESRQNVEILVINEPETLNDAVSMRLRLKLHYPDGPHNAEGFAVHPNGDLYILTKALSTTWSAASGNSKPRPESRPARLYRLERSAWIDGNRKEHRLTFAGTLDLPALLKEKTSWPLAHIATSFAFAPDGQRFVVLTYQFVMEFNHDLSRSPLPATSEFREGENYRIIKTKRLPYQEAITYLADGRTLIYHTEEHGAPQEIIRIDCQD